MATLEKKYYVRWAPHFELGTLIWLPSEKERNQSYIL